MIYLLDCTLTENSHSRYMIDIISKHTTEPVELIEISENATYGEIAKTVLSLFTKATYNDIVLCPWAVTANYYLDQIFEDLSERTWVVAAAGNFDADIKDYTPARSSGVIAVACLNKSGLKAALSNWGDSKEIIWVAGTNYDVGWKNSSGTSVSAAIYTAFLAESIRKKDVTLLDKLLEEHRHKVFNELINN